jgi:hypothetical protein
MTDDVPQRAGGTGCVERYCIGLTGIAPSFFDVMRLQGTIFVSQLTVLDLQKECIIATLDQR